jgi:hypothetical protein
MPTTPHVEQHFIATETRPSATVRTLVRAGAAMALLIS